MNAAYRDRPTPPADWWHTARCEARKKVWRDEMRCMRPAGHEGRHRGSRMIPETVWWEDA